MDRLSSFVLAHRRWVFAFWLVAFLAGGVASGQVSKRLSYDFSLPGQSGYQTEQKLIKAYGGANAEVAYVPVVTVPAGATVPVSELARPTQPAPRLMPKWMRLLLGLLSEEFQATCGTSLGSRAKLGLMFRLAAAAPLLTPVPLEEPSTDTQAEPV